MASVDTLVSGMAGRYALALFELARDAGSLDQVAQDLGTFQRLMNESPDLSRLVRSPVFSVEDQGRALGAILPRAGIGGLSANFLKLVASKRRLFAAADMIKTYNALVDAHRKVVRAAVTVAEPLSDSHLQALKSALNESTGGQDVALDVRVDPAILGGLVVQMGSRMVDGSLRTKLNNLRTRMKEVG